MWWINSFRSFREPEIQSGELESDFRWNYESGESFSKLFDFKKTLGKDSLVLGPIGSGPWISGPGRLEP